MRFSALYARLILAWPKTIALDDAHMPLESGAQLFPTLAALNAKIESQVDVVNDPWAHVGQWALFQSFHEEAQRCYRKGIRSLNTRAVSLELISSRVLTNLSAEGWEVERAAYRPYPD